MLSDISGGLSSCLSGPVCSVLISSSRKICCASCGDRLPKFLSQALILSPFNRKIVSGLWRVIFSGDDLPNCMDSRVGAVREEEAASGVVHLRFE